jgi:23S rRNA (guanosine2251-2'-O)-methyltransferase
MAFVIGNEGRGIRKKTGEHCDFLLSLPMENGVESLNASVSAALICYEWKRQVIQRNK